MKRAFVLAEGPTEMALLERLLPPEVMVDVLLVDGVGRTFIPSKARTLLVTWHRPVAVVLDSDSVEPDTIVERHQEFDELIRMASGGTPVKVISAIPNTEAWFFAAPEAIGRVLGRPVDPEWIALGRRDPRGILQHLAEKNNTTWDLRRGIAALDDQDVQRIRTVPEVAELTAFLREAKGEGRAA